MARRRKRDKVREDVFQTIGMTIGGEQYALPIDRVQEIVPRARITRVPKAPTHIMGVMNLRGNIVPVIDIAKRFEIGETTVGDEGRIVVVAVNGEVVGLAAERVSQVIKLQRSLIEPTPPLVSRIAAEYLEGVACLADRMLIFLNLPKVLADPVAATA